MKRRSGYRRCDFCRMRVSGVGPAFDIYRVGKARSRTPRILLFRLCSRCYAPLKRVLDENLEARGLPLGAPVNEAL